jgi:FkbM family methyltransferase
MNPRRLFRQIKKGVKFLLTNKEFAFFDKIKILCSSNINWILQLRIRERIVEAPDGTKFFDIGGYKIYFHPDYRILEEKTLIFGIVSELIETFIFSEYFTTKVNIKEGDVVLDIGANIGSTTLLFSRLVGEKGKVFAFEPVADDILRLNIEKNNIKNAEVIPKAVSNQQGKAEIGISDYSLDSTLIHREYMETWFNKKRMIDKTTIDAFAEEKGLERVDFINVDVEGMEELVIRGAEKVIKKHRPKWSTASYHRDFRDEPQHGKLVKLFKEFGYNVEELDETHIYAW